MSKPRDVYLVIGGSGFVGRHIVQQLLDRGDNVSVFDIVLRYHDVPFFSGDITNEEQLISALRTVRDASVHVHHHNLCSCCRVVPLA
jgi:sterol-4alpha-carboxylate 3-dehydrogenase (decarboxylating)